MAKSSRNNDPFKALGEILFFFDRRLERIEKKIFPDDGEDENNGYIPPNDPNQPDDGGGVIKNYSNKYYNNITADMYKLIDRIQDRIGEMEEKTFIENQS